MKNTAGRLPSSAGGLSSFGAFFSRNAGYGVMTTSAFGGRPKRSGIAFLARASAACESAIFSSRLLKRQGGVGAQPLQQRRHIAGSERALADRALPSMPDDTDRLS